MNAQKYGTIQRAQTTFVYFVARLCGDIYLACVIVWIHVFWCFVAENFIFCHIFNRITKNSCDQLKPTNSCNHFQLRCFSFYPNANCTSGIKQWERLFSEWFSFFVFVLNLKKGCLMTVTEANVLTAKSLLSFRKKLKIRSNWNEYLAAKLFELKQ